MADRKRFQSLKGQLLLDGGQLRGSFFNRAVVLICEHNEEGAFGLVLNHSTKNKVGENLEADLPDLLKEMPLFLGGPVETAALSYLHTDGAGLNADVMADLTLSHSLEGLLELATSFSPARKLRVFAGYAGWAAGQLESEIARDAWLIHPASVDLIFPSDPAKLWSAILREKGGKYRLLAQAPEDLSWN